MLKEWIGLFGGSFDPPHVGHLILASEAYAQLKLTRLLWILTPTPPHKLGRLVSPVEHRLAMLQSAIAGNASFELSRVELDRPGPHYTLDTVQQIRSLYPSSGVVLLIGGDSLHDLPAWHRPAELVAACDRIGVMRRPEDAIDLDSLEAALPGLGEKLAFVKAPLLQIASSEIRRRASAGEPFRYYLPPPVYDYIIQQHLYAT